MSSSNYNLPNDTKHTSPNGPKRRKLDNTRPGPGRRKGACQPCRIKKVKCDNSKPTCSMCKNTNSECVYLEIPGEPLTLETATDLVLERLEKLDRQIELLNRPTQSSSPYQTTESLAPRHREKPVLDGKSSFEPSRDFLQIPPHQTTSDTVLAWPIFGESRPPNSLVAPLFRSAGNPSYHASTSLLDDYFTIGEGAPPLNEEQIPSLVDNFLENVHTKNPILDVEALVIHSRQCAKEGLRWDGMSCLVLLACALGAIAKPFHLACDPILSPQEISSPARHRQTSPPASEKELQLGEYCFVLACRRMGLLKPSLAAAQCNFFAGVYLMYTLRPIQSWQRFFQASILYALYLRMKSEDFGEYADELTGQQSEYEETNRQRLEQCLYWSCFKSECEFRVELDLPQSEIATYEFPHMFPSPPTPLESNPAAAASLSPTLSSASGPIQPRPHSHSFTNSTTRSSLEIRLHAKRLCNEEESWYYYLTEIALRRIGNRIINTFFRCDRALWLNIKPLLTIAVEFDAQVSSWSANLPPAMQRYETSSAIRAPPGSNEAGSVSRELSWATENRILEMRSWLYQPFLYHLVHKGVEIESDRVLRSPTQEIGPVASSSSSQLSPDEANILRQLIASGIQCNLKIIETRSLPHRHHGLWYDLRALMCASLVLLAVVHSGHDYLIPGGHAALWGTESTAAVVMGEKQGERVGEREEAMIGGMLGRVLESFDLWAHEAVDMHTHREVLENLIIRIRDEYHERRRG